MVCSLATDLMHWDQSSGKSPMLWCLFKCHHKIQKKKRLKTHSFKIKGKIQTKHVNRQNKISLFLWADLWSMWMWVLSTGLLLKDLYFILWSNLRQSSEMSFEMLYKRCFILTSINLVSITSWKLLLVFGFWLICEMAVLAPPEGSLIPWLPHCAVTVPSGP